MRSIPGSAVRRFAIVCFSSAVLVGALLGSASAQQGVHVFHTNVTIHASPGGKVAPGSTLTVLGVLAGNPICRAFQPITIWDENGMLGTTTTDGKGHYQFDVIAHEGMLVQARYGGLRTGEHPGRTICLPSESRWLKVKTTSGSGKLHGSIAAAKLVALAVVSRAT